VDIVVGALRGAPETRDLLVGGFSGGGVVEEPGAEGFYCAWGGARGVEESLVGC
jgi:hypothetical protein